MILSRNISSAFVLSVALAANLLCCMIENTHAFEEATGGLASKTQLRREDGLDHWDSDTLAYYLDNYPGYDLAVMFYAPWDTNSQRLAPYWNQIAHAMGAGSIQSNLIMVRAVTQRFISDCMKSQWIILYYFENSLTRHYFLPSISFSFCYYCCRRCNKFLVHCNYLVIVSL